MSANLKKIILGLICIAGCASIMRQAPMVWIPYNVLYWLKFVWILPLLMLLCLTPRDFLRKKLFPLYAFIGLFTLFCIIASFATGYDYFGRDLYNICCSMTIAAISFVYWENYGKESDLRIMANVMLAPALIYAVYFFIFELPTLDYSLYRSGYGDKNALSLVFLTVVTFSIAIPPSQSRKGVYWQRFSEIVIFLAILLLRSRAVYLGVMFLAIFGFFRIKNTRTRYIVLGITAALGIIIMAVPYFYENIVNQLILASRPLDNPELFFSHRPSLIAKEMPTSSLEWLLGRGCVYLDSFPIASIIQYGVIGAILIFSFILWVGSEITRAYRPHRGLSMATMLVFWIIIINSLLEAHPPFGTGIKCFMLWMLFGFTLANAKTGVRGKIKTSANRNSKG